MFEHQRKCSPSILKLILIKAINGLFYHTFVSKKFYGKEGSEKICSKLADLEKREKTKEVLEIARQFGYKPSNRFGDNNLTIDAPSKNVKVLFG